MYMSEFRLYSKTIKINIISIKRFRIWQHKTVEFVGINVFYVVYKEIMYLSRSYRIYSKIILIRKSNILKILKQTGKQNNLYIAKRY